MVIVLTINIIRQLQGPGGGGRAAIISRPGKRVLGRTTIRTKVSISKVFKKTINETPGNDLNVI